MGFLKRKLGRWTVPTILTGVVVAAVAISPAFGGSKTVTTKKVKKITTNKINANNALTHATELRVTDLRHSGNTFNLDAPDSLMASQTGLPAGAYVIQTTFTVVRDGSGLVVRCELRAGGAKDNTDFFSAGQVQDNGAMSVTTNLAAGTAVELRCVDGSAGTDSRISNIEFTAIRVPGVSTSSTP
jgi:hypothetical protein